MLKRAVASNPLVRLSTWETEQEGWSRTRLVLDAYADKLKAFSKSGRDEDRPDWLPGSVGTEEAAEAGLYLLCGDDLLESFNTPGLWAQDDVSAS